MFTKDDLMSFRMLKGALELAKFELKGQEVLRAAPVFAWFYNLEPKIVADIQAQELKAKEVQEPVKQAAPEVKAKR